jgi:hypothetical protein
MPDPSLKALFSKAYGLQPTTATDAVVAEPAVTGPDTTQDPPEARPYKLGSGIARDQYGRVNQPAEAAPAGSLRGLFDKAYGLNAAPQEDPAPEAAPQEDPAPDPLRDALEREKKKPSTVASPADLDKKLNIDPEKKEKFNPFTPPSADSGPAFAAGQEKKENYFEQPYFDGIGKPQAPKTARGFWQNLGYSIANTGLDQFPGSVAGTVGAVESLAGQTGAKLRGGPAYNYGAGAPAAMYKYAKEQEAQSAELPTFNNFTDIGQNGEYLSDILSWAGSSVGQSAAQILPNIATMGLYGFFAEAGSIYTEGIDKVSEKTGLSPEQVIAHGLDAPAVALIAGGINGALEYIVPKSLSKGLGAELVMQSLKARIARGVGKVLLDSGKEGVTEYVQSAISQTVTEMIGEGKYNTEALIMAANKIDHKQAFNEGMAGMFGGGSISVASTTYSDYKNEKSRLAHLNSVLEIARDNRLDELTGSDLIFAAKNQAQLADMLSQMPEAAWVASGVDLTGFHGLMEKASKVNEKMESAAPALKGMSDEKSGHFLNQLIEAERLEGLASKEGVDPIIAEVYKKQAQQAKALVAEMQSSPGLYVNMGTLVSRQEMIELIKQGELADARIVDDKQLQTMAINKIKDIKRQEELKDKEKRRTDAERVRQEAEEANADVSGYKNAWDAVIDRVLGRFKPKQQEAPAANATAEISEKEAEIARAQLERAQATLAKDEAYLAETEKDLLEDEKNGLDNASARDRRDKAKQYVEETKKRIAALEGKIKPAQEAVAMQTEEVVDEAAFEEQPETALPQAPAAPELAPAVAEAPENTAQPQQTQPAGGSLDALAAALDGTPAQETGNPISSLGEAPQALPQSLPAADDAALAEFAERNLPKPENKPSAPVIETTFVSNPTNDGSLVESGNKSFKGGRDIYQVNRTGETTGTFQIADQEDAQKLAMTLPDRNVEFVSEMINGYKQGETARVITITPGEVSLVGGVWKVTKKAVAAWADNSGKAFPSSDKRNPSYEPSKYEQPEKKPAAPVSPAGKVNTPAPAQKPASEPETKPQPAPKPAGPTAAEKKAAREAEKAAKAQEKQAQAEKTERENQQAAQSERPGPAALPEKNKRTPAKKKDSLPADPEALAASTYKREDALQKVGDLDEYLEYRRQGASQKPGSKSDVKAFDKHLNQKADEEFKQEQKALEEKELRKEEERKKAKELEQQERKKSDAWRDELKDTLAGYKKTNNSTVLRSNKEGISRDEEAAQIKADIARLTALNEMDPKMPMIEAIARLAKGLKFVDGRLEKSKEAQGRKAGKLKAMIDNLDTARKAGNTKAVQEILKKFQSTDIKELKVNASKKTYFEYLSNLDIHARNRLDALAKGTKVDGLDKALEGAIMPTVADDIIEIMEGLYDQVDNYGDGALRDISTVVGKTVIKAALKTGIAAVKAGQSVHDAVNAAVDYVKEHQGKVRRKFDQEFEFRSIFEEIITDALAPVKGQQAVTENAINRRVAKGIRDKFSFPQREVKRAEVVQMVERALASGQLSPTLNPETLFTELSGKINELNATRSPEKQVALPTKAEVAQALENSLKTANGSLQEINARELKGDEAQLSQIREELKKGAIGQDIQDRLLALAKELLDKRKAMYSEKNVKAILWRVANARTYKQMMAAARLLENAIGKAQFISAIKAAEKAQASLKRDKVDNVFRDLARQLRSVELSLLSTQQLDEFSALAESLLHSPKIEEIKAFLEGYQKEHDALLDAAPALSEADKQLKDAAREEARQKRIDGLMEGAIVQQARAKAGLEKAKSSGMYTAQQLKIAEAAAAIDLKRLPAKLMSESFLAAYNDGVAVLADHGIISATLFKGVVTPYNVETKAAALASKIKGKGVSEVSGWVRQGLSTSMIAARIAKMNIKEVAAPILATMWGAMEKGETRKVHREKAFVEQISGIVDAGIMTEEDFVAINAFGRALDVSHESMVPGNQAALEAEIRDNIASYTASFDSAPKKDKEKAQADKKVAERVAGKLLAGSHIADYASGKISIQQLAEIALDEGHEKQKGGKPSDLYQQMRTDLDRLLQEMQFTAEVVHGKGFGTTANYFPSQVITSKGVDHHSDQRHDELIEQMISAPTAARNISIQESAFARARKGGDKNYYQANAMQVYDRYISSALMDIEMAPGIYETAGLLRSEQLSSDEALGQHNQTQIKENVKHYIATVRGQRTSLKGVARWVEKISANQVTFILKGMKQFVNQGVVPVMGYAMSNPEKIPAIFRAFSQYHEAIFDNSHQKMAAILGDKDTGLTTRSVFAERNSVRDKFKDGSFDFARERPETYKKLKRGSKVVKDLFGWSLLTGDGMSAKAIFLTELMAQGIDPAQATDEQLAAARIMQEGITQVNNPSTRAEFLLPKADMGQFWELMHRNQMFFKGHGFNQLGVNLSAAMHAKNSPEARRMFVNNIAQAALYRAFTIAVMPGIMKALLSAVSNGEDEDLKREDEEKNNTLLRIGAGSLFDLGISGLPAALDLMAQYSTDALWETYSNTRRFNQIKDEYGKVGNKQRARYNKRAERGVEGYDKPYKAINNGIFFREKTGLEAILAATAGKTSFILEPVIKGGRMLDDSLNDKPVSRVDAFKTILQIIAFTGYVPADVNFILQPIYAAMKATTRAEADTRSARRQRAKGLGPTGWVD